MRTPILSALLPSFAGRKSRTRKPRLLSAEPLEDRRLLAYCVVSDGVATHGPGTIENCFIQAANDAADDTIVFNASLTGQTISVAGAFLEVREGRGKMFLDGSDRGITLDAGGNNEHFHVTEFLGQPRTTLRVENLRLINGSPLFGPASSIHAADASLKLSGMVIENNSGGRAVVVETDNDTPDPDIDIRHSAFRNNNGGALRLGNQGFITTNTTTSGTITIASSEFSGNSVMGVGGAISIHNATHAGSHFLSVRIDNSTISGNTSTNDGAGIYIGADMTDVRLLNDTIAQNTIITGGSPTGGKRGGGLHVSSGNPVSTTEIHNTIVYGNSSVHANNQDIYFHPAIIGSGGNNLVQDATGFTGVVSIQSDPMLLPLAQNGGFSRTHAFSAASSAKDAGNSAAWLAAHPNGPVRKLGDQRGPMYSRIAGNSGGTDVIDIGAFECNNSIWGRAVNMTSRYGTSPRGPGFSNLGVTATKSASPTQSTRTTYAPLQSVVNIDINADGRIDPLIETGWYWFDDLDSGLWTTTATVPTNFAILNPHASIINAFSGKGAGLVSFPLTRIARFQSGEIPDFGTAHDHFVGFLGPGAPVGGAVNTINFDDVMGTFSVDQYFDSHGVFFDVGATPPNLFGVFAEGDPSTVQNLDGYDGSIRPDGNPVLVKWPNDVEPLTIRFTDPISTFGAFIATGMEGTEDVVTVSAFDDSGNLIATTANIVQPFDDAQRREGYFVMKMEQVRIASISIQNENHEGFGSAIVLDDMFWARPADNTTAFDEAADNFGAFFASQPHPVTVLHGANARLNLAGVHDAIWDIDVASGGNVTVRNLFTGDCDDGSSTIASCELDISSESGGHVGELEGYDGSFAQDGEFVVYGEIQSDPTDPDSDDDGIWIRFETPVSSVGSFVALTKCCEYDIELTVGKGRGRFTGFDSNNNVVTTTTIDLDAYQTFDNAEGFWMVESAAVDISSVLIQAIDEAGNVMTDQYAVMIDRLTFTRPPHGACDLNGDGGCDGADADELVAAIVAGSMDPLYDLTGDGLVNSSDMDQWLVSAGEINLGPGRVYLRGDGNLDGVVDGSDFNLWNAHKFSGGGNWSGGDWNSDGFTDGSDFNLWNAHKFQSSDTQIRISPLSSAVGTAQTMSHPHRDDDTDKEHERFVDLVLSNEFH